MNSNANFCSLNSNNTSCPNCFYGPKCQFTTAYYGITSLQILFCSIESVSKSLILSVFVIGSVCNLFSIVTFCQPNTREMGSGIYRLWISIVGQIGLVIVVSHLLLANNRKIGCVLLEYLRKAVHAAYDSLTACTTLERTMVIYQGITFNKIAVFFMSHLSVSVRNMLHFTIPYIINFVSPIIWILTLTKQKVTLYQNATVWANFKNVLHTYKHTIISCYILVLFNTPRFIFIFSLTCIKFQWQNTAYITAYFLSLVPLMGNLFIFVIPSPKYRPVFLGLLQNLMKYRYRNDYDRA
ncbi:unnamed protein product [Adineta ricciae]|uniref:Uncharacterized protein n=1 Tax=Adineta ricciae TaxID=249248 RepID=A0A814UHT2_ADIRI|nr:unnamed protein product [Adineta ricciae]